jgi:hypothetical protein
MTRRRLNPRAVSQYRSYSVTELAACFGVHKNTVRHWQLAGLKPNDDGRPYLFRGGVVRTFLTERNASRKRPCQPGTLYCFRCRDARQPALGMVEFVGKTATLGTLRAICAECETLMNRKASRAALSSVMPGINVQIVLAPPRLSDGPSPPLNCDSERRTVE